MTRTAVLCLAIAALIAMKSGVAALPPAGEAIPDAFRTLDANADGFVSEQEYVTGGGIQTPALRREFIVFDADGDGRLTPHEFLTIPNFTPEDQQSALPDPTVLLSKSHLKIVTDRWTDWDQDGDGALNRDEFMDAGIGRHIPGLESSGFDDWDRNHDEKLSPDDAALLLDIACGVRVPAGDLLRTGSGKIGDWRTFLALKPDANGKVGREDYIRAVGANPESWFPNINTAGHERFTFAQFMTSNHRVDTVTMFLNLDADLNGRLNAAELLGLPDGWGAPPSRAWLPGFDDDQDGGYSLREFQLIPHINLFATWDTAVDANGDGTLGADEFRLMPGPALSALTAEYFRRLDVNHNQSLSLNEWPFITSHPESKFKPLDADSDGELSEAEFTADQTLPKNRQLRDFKVFDADSNGRMTMLEFTTNPAWIPEALRSPIPDPVIMLASARLSDLKDHWRTWDASGDGSLEPNEFQASRMGSRVRGLETMTFAEWDSDRDRKLTLMDVERILDIAFGVRSPTGELLRTPAGNVVDWRSFNSFGPDSNGRVRRSAYIRSRGSPEQAELTFPTITTAGCETFSVTDFAKSSHRTDPVGLFLSLDVDFSGRLTRDELMNLPSGWGPPGRDWLPGFDDDGDDAYSLREFQLIPHVNLLVTWHSAQDGNSDGKLSEQEFRFMRRPVLAALSAEYFRRLDQDRDGFLSLKEWPFYQQARVVATRSSVPESAPIATFLGLKSPRIRSFVVYEIAILLLVMTGFGSYRWCVRRK